MNSDPNENDPLLQCPKHLQPLRDLWVAMAERTMSLANEPVRRAEAARCTDLIEAVYLREKRGAAGKPNPNKAAKIMVKNS